MGKVVDKFAPVVGALGAWWFFGHGFEVKDVFVFGFGWWWSPQAWAWFKDLVK